MAIYIKVHWNESKANYNVALPECDSCRLEIEFYDCECYREASPDYENHYCCKTCKNTDPAESASKARPSTKPAFVYKRIRSNCGRLQCSFYGVEEICPGDSSTGCFTCLRIYSKCAHRRFFNSTRCEAETRRRALGSSSLSLHKPRLDDAVMDGFCGECETEVTEQRICEERARDERKGEGRAWEERERERRAREAVEMESSWYGYGVGGTRNYEHERARGCGRSIREGASGSSRDQYAGQYAGRYTFTDDQLRESASGSSRGQYAGQYAGRYTFTDDQLRESASGSSRGQYAGRYTFTDDQLRATTPRYSNTELRSIAHRSSANAAVKNPTYYDGEKRYRR